MQKKIISEDGEEASVSRRHFCAKTSALVLGTTVLGSSHLLEAFAKTQKTPAAKAQKVSTIEGIPSRQTTNNIIVEQGGTKPVYLPAHDTRDPMVHSLADNLFWNDIMMEHSLFFVLLMPGDELAVHRQKAAQFQDQFARHLQVIRQQGMNPNNYRAINQRTIELVKPLVAFKLKMLELQNAGKIHTLVWPLFFFHTAREGKRFISRLEMYNRGNVEFNRPEVVEFWSFTMGEHAQFISHLLDPQEVSLISKADETADIFLNTLRVNAMDTEALLRAGEDIVNFKTAAEKGIETGKIKSIIHPALADHVRREAVKYVDELKRSS